MQWVIGLGNTHLHLRWAEWAESNGGSKLHISYLKVMLIFCVSLLPCCLYEGSDLLQVPIFVSLYVASSRCSLSSTFYCSFPSKHASVGSIQCNDDGSLTKQVSDICRGQRGSFQLKIRKKMTENETFLTWWLMNLNMIKSLFFSLEYTPKQSKLARSGSKSRFDRTICMTPRTH